MGRSVLIAIGGVVSAVCVLFIFHSRVTLHHHQQDLDQCMSDKPIQVHYFNKRKSLSTKVFKSCRHKCYLTYGKSSYNTSHVVLFHGPSIGKGLTLPPHKGQGQIWILHGKEAPVNYLSTMEKWNNLFNWTMTYRRDSDIVALNGVFVPKIGNALNDNFTTFYSKVKNVAWFVSNCHTQSHREQYVKKLRRYTDVTIFGKCGKLRCSRAKDHNCMNILTRDFRFYLSFENSFCHDYITEKSFKIYRNNVSTIPITRGLQGHQYDMYLPPRSFVNTADFSSVKSLVTYITEIVQSKDSFDSYFNWRDTYTSRLYTPTDFCQLCERLHSEDKYRRLYTNISAWLTTGPQGEACTIGKDISKSH